MTTKGKLEVAIRIGDEANRDLFITILNFFNGLGSIGVTRIASNYGQGTGFTYGDGATPPGINAWAVYRFGNATIPFYVLVQMVSYSAANSATSIVPPTGSYSWYTSTTNASKKGVGISIAQRADGTSPWGGTTSNNGADTKGAPVWTPGGSSLLVWPRANANTGAFATNHEALMFLTHCNVTSAVTSFNDIQFGFSSIWQMLADENNLLFTWDAGDVGGPASALFYFGKFVPIQGMTNANPYVCLHNGNHDNNPTVGRFLWGSPTQQLSNTYSTSGDGGIALPDATQGVKVAFTDYVNTFNAYQFHPNRGAAVPSAGRYDMQPVWVGAAEQGFTGLLGSINFFRMCYGLPSKFVSHDKKLAVFGSNIVNTGKIVVPWDGVTIPGTAYSRNGIDF